VYQPSGRYIEFLVIDGQQRLTTISNTSPEYPYQIKAGKE
jgi:hypothetical protein